MIRYSDALRAMIDPGAVRPRPDGRLVADVSVVMLDYPDRDDRGAPWRPPAAFTLTPEQAREFAGGAGGLRGARRADRSAAMTVNAPAPPALSDELERLLRRLPLPYVRRAAPEVLATAAAQRWEHAEVLRVLLGEEAAGRDRATIQMRRHASGLPAGKTFDAWQEKASAIPKPAHADARE